MAEPARKIAVVQGAPSAEVQVLFRSLVDRWRVSARLAGAGALAAAEAVRRDIAAGCDLVVLSKFGNLEKNGRGLRDAFTAAIEADIPILTSVSPAYMAAWEGYAAPRSITLPLDRGRIDEWWQTVRSSAGAPRERAAG